MFEGGAFLSSAIFLCIIYFQNIIYEFLEIKKIYIKLFCKISNKKELLY